MNTSPNEVMTPSYCLRRRTLRGFAVLALGYALFGFGFIVLRQLETEDGLPWPLRRVLGFNATIGETLMKPARADLGRFQAPPPGRKARTNGGLGLSTPIDLERWRLTVISPGDGDSQDVVSEFNLDQIRALPKLETVQQFKCIEGWSEVMSFGGVRFSEFLKAYRLGTRSGQEPDFERRPNDLYSYVGLETPDGEYYVSVDMKSLWNPHVLLAYEQNGEVLTNEHGAPLRLYVPNKYGVKSLKRIGKITFSDEPLSDYWGEQGYDWFIGL